MKLNIYENKKIVKTYTAETYDLMWKTVTDVAKAVDIEALETGSDVEIIMLVGKLVINSRETVEALVVDIFDGLTVDELRNTKVTEIAQVLVDVVIFTMSQLKGKSKN